MTLSLWRTAEDHVWIQDIGTRNCNTEVTLETPRSWRCQSCGVPAQKNQPKRKNCAAVNKAERSWRSEECFNITHGDAVWRFPSWLLVLFWSTISSWWHLGMVKSMFWSGSIWSAFRFFFFRGLQLHWMNLRRDFELWTFNIFETGVDDGDFWSWTSCIFHYACLNMVLIRSCTPTWLWGPVSGIWEFEYTCHREWLY